MRSTRTSAAGGVKELRDVDCEPVEGRVSKNAPPREDGTSAGIDRDYVFSLRIDYHDRTARSAKVGRDFVVRIGGPVVRRKDLDRDIRRAERRLPLCRLRGPIARRKGRRRRGPAGGWLLLEG
jgi:hypothetical protein